MTFSLWLKSVIFSHHDFCPLYSSRNVIRNYLFSLPACFYPIKIYHFSESRDKSQVSSRLGCYCYLGMFKAISISCAS